MSNPARPPRPFVPREELQAIHAAALRILEETGVRLEHAGMRERLAKLGCRIRDDRMLIPERLVSETLKAIPPTFDLFGRSEEYPITVGGETIYGMNAGIFPNIYDFDSGKLRRATIEDVNSTTRLLDAMEHVRAVFVSMVDAIDVEPALAIPVCFAATLANTSKPLIGPGVASAAEARKTVRMALALRGGDAAALRKRPICAPFICPVSPLIFPAGIVEAIIAVAEAGLPLHVVTNPILGLTAPFTLAGAIAMGHAEVLAAAVIAHAVAPGLPIANQNTPTVPDLASLASTSGGPESALIRMTVAQLYRLIPIPCHANAQTSSPDLDLQAADEKSLNFLLIAQGRPALLGGVGALANATATSYETILLDNERLGAIGRVLRGVRVDAEHLALDVIAQGVRDKDFLTQEHTLRMMRSDEVWRPKLAVRHVQAYDRAAGASSLARARVEARKLLEGYAPPPLPEAVQRAIFEIAHSPAIS